MTTDLQPDTGEVLQAEPDDVLTTLPVCVQEVRAPVRTQSLPRKAGSTRTRSVGTTPVRVLTADHRRASAVLVASAAFRVAFNEASAQDSSSMSWWPANVPFTATCATEVWAMAETGTVDVSITTERWAAGESGAD